MTRPETQKKYTEFIVVLYPENPLHVAMLNYLEDRPARYKIAYILHDRDVWTESDQNDDPSHVAGERKKPHYHVLIKQRDRQAVTAFVKFFSLWINYAEGCNSTVSTLAYFLHDTPDSLCKAHYDLSELKGDPALLRLIDVQNSSFTQFRALLNTVKCLDGKMYDIADAISEQGLTDVYDSDDLMATLSRYQGILCTASNQIRADRIKGV